MNTCLIHNGTLFEQQRFRHGSQSKIAEIYKQETRRKKKIEQENGRELSDDNLYTINLSHWQMETPLETGLETPHPPPSPFNPKENTL